VSYAILRKPFVQLSSSNGAEYEAPATVITSAQWRKMLQIFTEAY